MREVRQVSKEREKREERDEWDRELHPPLSSHGQKTTRTQARQK